MSSYPRPSRFSSPMGLAEPMPGNEWAVRKDFESVLRASALGKN